MSRIACCFAIVALSGCAIDGPLPTGVYWPNGLPSPEERELAGRLKRHVDGKLGLERHLGIAGVAGLKSAEAYIQEQLTTWGLGMEAVSLQSVEGDRPRVAQNLEAKVIGLMPHCKSIVVGAHYDSARGAPGANDNGTGTAALIELARWAHGERFLRTVRFAFFANEEPPYFSEEANSLMGSSQYISRIPEADWPAAMISLETIGYYTNLPASQCLVPRGLWSSTGAPQITGHGESTRVSCVLSGDILGSEFAKGDFIAFVSSWGNFGIVSRARKAFEGVRARVKVASLVVPPLPGILWSDHAPFVARGIPAFMVTDTAPMRYPYYHTAQDAPAALSFQSWLAVSRVVLGLRAVVRDLADHPEGCTP